MPRRFWNGFAFDIGKSAADEIFREHPDASSFEADEMLDGYRDAIRTVFRRGRTDKDIFKLHEALRRGFTERWAELKRTPLKPGGAT